MLAEKNENIKAAYEILQRISKSKEARMAYEARQAEIMDQLTREKSAVEKTKIEIAKNALLMNLPIEQIEKLTGLSIEIIKGLKN